MPITKQRDPRTKKEITFVEGKVEKIYVNPVKEIKTYAGPNGPWTPTHIINFVVDGIRIGLGLTDKTEVRGKTEDDKYHDVTEGSTVTVEISKIGEYKGKPTYETKPSLIFINDLAPASAAPARGAGNTEGRPAYSGKRDTSGIETGHALNGAMRLLGGKAKPEEIVEAAKQVHDLTVLLKVEYAEANPNMSEYDCGAAVGNAVLNSIDLAVGRKKGLEAVPDIARKWLADIVVPVAAYVKAPAAPAAQEPPAEEPAKDTPSADDFNQQDFDEDLPF